MARTHALDPSTIAAYARDGAVVLRGVFTPAELQRLEAGIEHNLAHLSPLALVASEPDDPGRFVECRIVRAAAIAGKAVDEPEQLAKLRDLAAGIGRRRRGRWRLVRHGARS